MLSKRRSLGKGPEGTQYQEGNERSVWKDMSSASIAFGITRGKDSLVSPRRPSQATILIILALPLPIRIERTNGPISIRH